MESKLSIGVILASVREGRRGEAFAHWIHALLSGRAELTPQLLDLKEWAFPGYAYRETTPTAEQTYEPGSLAGRWRDQIAALDAFVIVTPEYNHGYSGALKNALDHVYAPWNRKPVAFVSYGGSASGARAVEQLVQVAVELRMVPVRDTVTLALRGLPTDERGWPTDPFQTKRASRMIEELLWWTRITREGRAALVR